MFYDLMTNTHKGQSNTDTMSLSVKYLSFYFILKAIIILYNIFMNGLTNTLIYAPIYIKLFFAVIWSLIPFYEQYLVIWFLVWCFVTMESGNV